ncbi:hypothetical protein V9T40_007327 [Parthenolecanium corni]|uniref:Arrestin C-terminal-like domain-containing protein n=1 Tax=Parthenolecanium corni TaxID=536013 RepID=A0AAN9TUD8_9HEMI
MSTRVFKKSAQNNKLTIYLGTRDVVISEKAADKIQGVVLIDPDYLQDKKVYGQITLTFRYGREDEEVMGLKFCNEAIMCLAQLYPPHEKAPQQPLTPLQDALIKRLGPNAHPFTMEVTPMAPPSVQLVPAKEYNGAPIGTSYDIRAFAAHRTDEKQHRRNTVRMGIRVIQRATVPPKSSSSMSQQPSCEENPPHVTLNKQFLLSDGKIKLEASLDKAVYSHGDSIQVSVSIINETKKSIRRLKTWLFDTAVAAYRTGLLSARSPHKIKSSFPSRHHQYHHNRATYVHK